MTIPCYNMESETGRPDATNVKATLTNKRIGGTSMADLNLTTTLSQVSSIAPNLAELLRSRASRLKATVTSGDAINGYGYTLAMVLRVEVLTDRCQHCGETQFSAPVFDCRHHRFVREWRQIADTAAPSLLDALLALDEKIEQWTEQIERRAA